MNPTGQSERMVAEEDPPRRAAPASTASAASGKVAPATVHPYDRTAPVPLLDDSKPPLQDLPLRLEHSSTVLIHSSGSLWRDAE